MKEKRGQLFGLSFSMIFSIILIVVFLAIAFIAIRAFLTTQDCAKIGIFVDDFKNRVDKAWASQQEDSQFKGSLPNNLEYVCFFDLDNKNTGVNSDIGDALNVFEGTGSNMFFYPVGKACSAPRHNINHLDIQKITSGRNPYCIKVDNGNVNLNLKKGFNDRLVSIS